MDISFSLSRKYLANILGVAAGLALIWLLRSHWLAFGSWMIDQQAVSETIRQYGSWGPVVLFVLLVLQVFVAFIPGNAPILAGGYIYGFTAGIAIALFSTVLASQIAFLIARRYGRRMIYRMASPQAIERWDALALNRDGVFYFFALVLPFFPNDLMCYVAGLGTITSRQFFLANLFGRSVAVVFFTLVGAYGFQMPWFLWGITLLALAILYSSWRVYSRSSKIKLQA